MELKNKVIVITGGATGIGAAIIQQVIQDNTVVSLDRSQQKIGQLKGQYPSVRSILCDITDAEQINHAMQVVEKEFGRVDLLINNAGVGKFYDFQTTNEEELQVNLTAELNTNFIAPIQLSKKALPLLQKSVDPAIVFITSGLVYVPYALAPGYCASKSALSFYVKSLRFQLRRTKIRIIEAQPPTVDTDFNKGLHVKKIAPAQAAAEIVKGIAANQNVIQVGQVKSLAIFSRLLPSTAFRALNPDK